jgi:hypothetical protein
VAASTPDLPPDLPPAYAGLVDDAAVFPPREASLAEAVAEHREARDGPYAGLLGPFVVDDRRLPALLEHLGGSSAAEPEQPPLAVTVVVTGGAGAVEPAVRRAVARGRPTGDSPDPAGVDLRGVELALRDLDDLTGAARRVVAAVRSAQELAPGAAYCVELPLTHVPDPATSPDWLGALDELAAEGLRLKLRTGGLEAAAFPTAPVLAAAVDAALDRELSFKCTAGLHHAVRHRAADTGFEHHGFLNLLLATAAAWDGAGREEVVRLLEEDDAAPLAARAAGDQAALTAARRWFTSFGCCAVVDPLGDLLELGLVRRAP